MQPANMTSSLDLPFSNGLTARAVRLQERVNLAGGLAAIGLQGSHPVLVIVGGASHLSTADYQKLEDLFTGLLAPLAEELGLVVVDGGTNAGVMQLMGVARAKIHGTFPLVGVAPIGKVQLPGIKAPEACQQLEPHHTHFVLVPGDQWGDESPWIAETASILSQDSPSVTLLMNGGEVSFRDVRESVGEQRLVVVIVGTGRLADRIAQEIQTSQELSPKAFSMHELKQDHFKLIDLANSEIELKPFLKQLFKPIEQESNSLKLNP
jgi:hypothetical protein